ncbi:MAG: GMC family oxidoreductase [Flavobacteriales bacterium]|nr:GMC family oxidoreductase [Flavobacteriales bacterium]MCC6936711.1 GMC family oxidoreductase [Flavobacteriales bacterium]
MSKQQQTTDEEYDVVIVGAGMSGAIVALELAKAGKRVLILEAGRALSDDEEGWQSAVDYFYTQVAKVPNSPYPPTGSAPQPDVLQYQRIKDGIPNSSGYWVQRGPQSFGSDYTRTKGGTTLHWLACSLRMLPNDFKMNTNYGVAMDWPIEYEDLRPYYELAEYEIGVACDADAYWLPGVDPKTYWKGYQYPMKAIPSSYVAKRFAEKAKGLKVDVLGKDYTIRVTPTPQGRNGMPNPDYVPPAKIKKELEEARKYTPYKPQGAFNDPMRGERCQGNANCVPICPVQAKYSALRTLHRAERYHPSGGSRYVHIKTQSVATRIVRNADNSRIDHIEYLTYQRDLGPTVPGIAKGKVYVIAAHAVETAKLCLMSGVANSSDQMGRNLMDHPTMLTWGLMDEPIWPFRGPGQTNAIASFRDGPFRSDHSACVVPIDNWGWIWGTFAPGSTVGQMIGEGKIGRDLRQSLANNVSRQFTLQWELEQLPEARNRVTIDPNFLDALGLPRPVINYSISDYVRRGMETAFNVSKKIFKHVGVADQTFYNPANMGYLEYNGKPYEFKGCGHLVGTHRLGSNSENSVTNSWLRTWDHENLYLVGCGAMPTWGTSNPSLTMAALAYRAAESILRDLNKEKPLRL